MPNIHRVAALLLLLTGCASSGRQASSGSQASMSTSTQGAGWRSLTSLGEWRGYKSQEVPTGWQQTPDGITKNVGVEDLVSRAQYGDFELELDWRLSPGGNAGIFYRATEAGDKIYWTGPEYQLLDDARHPDGKNVLTSAGSAYGLYAPPRGVVRPAGEWNTTRIVARGPHLEHWLNGQQVVAYDMWSPDWEAKVKASKFNEWKGYGRSARGYIGIQGDHTGELSLRNLRIRELK